MAERPVVPWKLGNARGGKGPWFKTTREVRKDRRLGDLVTPESVQKLQTALHAKAKAEPEFRFYALYDKVYRWDILAYAYACCRSNKGAAGVDGQDFGDIEEYGEEKWLGELAEELREKKYRPEAVRRVYIPKPNGKMRPLGIPCLRDRVCQTAAMLVLDPIFEADLQPEQFAYRSGRSALDAVRRVHYWLNHGHREVVDADLSGYFDTIPHSELMKSVARRVVDRNVLHLIKMWLETPVEDHEEKGKRRRMTRNRDQKRGTPQGSPISPLLSNLYMRRFVLGWKRLGFESRLDGKIVNYADDLVICCKEGRGKASLEAMRRMMGRLKLAINEEKTLVCRLPEGKFDFLGYTFGRCFSAQTGRPYIGARPSKKKVKQMLDGIRELTSRKTLTFEATMLVGIMNRKLIGWANYFHLGPVGKAYRSMDSYTTMRLRRWLCQKHKVGGKGTARFPDRYLYEEMNLVHLSKLTTRLPWAKA